MWILTIATIYLVHGTTFALPGGGNRLTSMNFPNTYPNNEDTVQTLSVPRGYSILITFQEFELETHGSCTYDYVQICDENNRCGKKLCGSSLPDPITVSTSTATVKFHSDGSVSRKGFSLTYKKIRPEVAAFSIVGGPSAREGNVFFGGRPICDDQWDNTDAGVFCRMMGYQNGNATSGSKYGQVSSDFSMDDVLCNGHETNLIDCNHTTQHNCGSSEGAGVICSGGSAFSISGGSSALEGNIFYDGKPICDDYWDNTDAGVFCRMMGYQNGNATHRSTYGQVSSDFSMDDIQCNGHETNLLDCNHTTKHNCGSSEGAGVICSGLFTSVAPSLEPVTVTTTESSSTIITDTEWDDYIESLSTNTTEWEDLDQDHLDVLGALFDYDAEIIDAMACDDDRMLVGEECVRDPTYCPDGKVFDGERCVYDPRNCPYGYFVEDGKCERDESIFIVFSAANAIVRPIPCRCRRGYHFSVRRRSEESPNGSCIRCRRRRKGMRSMCGC